MTARDLDRSLLAGDGCQGSVMRSVFCVLRSVYHARRCSAEPEDSRCPIDELLATQNAERITQNADASRRVAHMPPTARRRPFTAP
jgi:hypothetical protein